MEINLTKDTQDIFTENCKTVKSKKALLNEMQYSKIGRLSVIKLLVLTKSIYSFTAIPIKIPAGFCGGWKLTS